MLAKLDIIIGVKNKKKLKKNVQLEYVSSHYIMCLLYRIEIGGDRKALLH